MIGPLVWPRLAPRPEFIPVSIVTPPAAPPPAAEPEPAAEEPEEEPAPLPEPVVSEPERVPESIEDVRRRQEEEAERQRLEEERRERERQEEERRRREAEEEARRRAEEERRKQPQKAARSRPQSQEARRTGIDLTSAEDDRSSFTVEDFPFADYLLRIRDLISNEWDPPPSGAYSARRRSEVFFRIGRDGTLVVTPRILSASGNSLYDRAALQAIAQAAPFPPLPRQYQGQSLGVGLAFVQE